MSVAPAHADEAPSLQFATQQRAKGDDGHFRLQQGTTAWRPEETAVVICDMWDTHTCKNAAERVGQIAPRMDKLVRHLRERGVTVIHCPSDTMGFYAKHPARLRAQKEGAADPKFAPKVPLRGWCHLEKGREGELPIDDSDGGCDTPAEQQQAWSAKLKAEGRDPRRPWRRQIDAIHIDDDRDYITDSAEAYYIMRRRGIGNLLVMGVHTNMCVLGRPFSIRQMVYQDQNVVLVRDLTDAMYNPAKRPQVNHFRGTELVIAHIERHWCPTTTSADLLGDSSPQVFPHDKRPHAVFLIGEAEYDTRRTLVDFAERDLPDYRCTFLLADGEQPLSTFPGIAAVKSADLLILSVRRRTLPQAQLQVIRDYVDAGGPVVAIRTSSHAFALRKGEPAEGRAVWPRFDADILGGNYTGHHNNHGPDAPPTLVSIHPAAKQHPILQGVDAQSLPFRSSLYKTSPLAKSTATLLTGQVKGDNSPEPVAWTNQPESGGRVFYTSLGGPKDFEKLAFRKLLVNGIDWASHGSQTR